MVDPIIPSTTITTPQPVPQMYRTKPPPTEEQIYYHWGEPGDSPLPETTPPPPGMPYALPPEEPPPPTTPDEVIEPTPEPLPTDPTQQDIEQTELNQLLALNTTETKLLTLIEILKKIALLFAGKVL